MATMNSKIGLLCAFLSPLLLVALAQESDQTSCAHITGFGCTTTTTTCHPPSGQVGETTEARPGKRGPVGPAGPKGNKGDKGENDKEELTEMKRKVLELEKKVKKLQVSNKSHLRYATACSDYHDNEATENLEHVSIFYWKSGDQVLTIANCTKLEVVRSITSFPFEMKIPTNSLIGRTLIIEGTPRPSHSFSVNFVADSPERYIFHMDVRMQERILVRNDNLGTSGPGWNKEELTVGNAFPFQFGVPFRMEINTDYVGFHVKLDGRKLLTFTHRQRPISAISMIRIIGSLNVTFLSFN